MAQKALNSSGLSETIVMSLVILLVIGLAVIVYAMLFGSVSMTKSSLVAASAGTANVPLDTSSSMQIMRMQPMAGEAYYIKGQSSIPKSSATTPLAIASFSIIDPKGQTYTVTNGYITQNVNKYGSSLFIYKDQSGNYRLTDSLGSISYAPAQLSPFAVGEYQVTMIDNTANVPMNIMKIKITGNGTSSSESLSVPLLNTLPNSSWVIHGGVTNSTTTSGLNLYSFDGTSGYLSATANPSLSMTGNLTLSLWMSPTTASSDWSNSANWHTIIGKGRLNSDNSEYDNYQLFQLGNKLLFEWNDANTGTHYQAYTTSSALTAGTLQYVTCTVNNGVLSIAVNGVSQSLTYKTGNVPTSATTISAPTITLQNNGNDLLTGKQNAASASNYFYYSGDMSEVALYNRALTTDEINHNIQYSQI